MNINLFQVKCHRPGCNELATFKIAARWSDGQTDELKTYYLSCAACLAEHFQQSCVKQARCPLALGETLEVPMIFEWRRGERDRQLIPRPDLIPG